MNISYQWLRKYCPTDVSAQELAERLMHAGFPVEQMFKAAGDDWLLDVEVTSNRPDLLGHVGVARETAALTGAPFTPPQINPAGEPSDELHRKTSVTLEAPDACPYYTARIIEGVRVAPSPDWLVRAVETVGLRPVNNVVDVTNYVLYELSQPLHAFDYDKLAEGRIVVRMARDGETITAIDGHERKLDKSMLVIADANRPQAVAGVMGGLSSEVSEDTTTILLESAYFDPISIRSTARKLALFSDSSYRFERGVDPGGIEAASNRAVDLILDTCGGRAVDGFAFDGSLRLDTPEVAMRLGRMAQLLGIDIDPERVHKILSALQLNPNFDPDPQAPAQVTVTVPTFRQDIRREVDVIEEVGRVFGYNKIPVREHIEIDVTPPNPRQAATRRVARVLAALGYSETVSFTFLPADQSELFADGGGHLEVTHSSRRQENALRRSVLPSLLRARRHNETVGVGRADLFELAKVFHPAKGPLPEERWKLSLCTDGDFRAARGTLEELARQLAPEARVAVEPATRDEFEPDAAGRVVLDGEAIGIIGRPTAAVRDRFDLQGEVTLAEVDLQPLLDLAGRPRTFTPLARFPGIARDLSILVDAAAAWADIESAVRSDAPQELESIDFVEQFHGKQVPAGKKSITLTLTYRREAETLTHEKADQFVARALAALESNLGAKLREQ